MLWVVLLGTWLSSELLYVTHLATILFSGWELPISWATPDEDGRGHGGPKRAGRLKLNYTSNGPGCHPVWDVRKDLQIRFLCSNIPQQEVDWRTNTSSKLWELVSAHDKIRRSVHTPFARAITKTIQVIDVWSKNAKQTKVS